MKRFKWPLPSDVYFYRNMEKVDEFASKDRFERLKFLWEEFGPPADALLIGGIPSMFALHEMKESYLYGCFMGVVLLSQVFIELSLASEYALTGKPEMTKQKFSILINKSLEKGQITNELAEKFHKLREMRNPYTHQTIRNKKSVYMERLSKKEYITPEKLVVEDARFAIRTVVDYLRYTSPDWNPANSNWSENIDV